MNKVSLSWLFCFYSGRMQPFAAWLTIMHRKRIEYMSRLAQQDFSKFVFIGYPFQFSAMEVYYILLRVCAVPMPIQQVVQQCFLNRLWFVHPSLVTTAVNTVNSWCKPATTGCFTHLYCQTNPKYSIIKTCFSSFSHFTICSFSWSVFHNLAVDIASLNYLQIISEEKLSWRKLY